MYLQSVMRKPSILSTPPPAHREPSPSLHGAKRAEPRAGTLLFDTCRIGVVLRAVLLVETRIRTEGLDIAITRSRSRGEDETAVLVAPR